MLVNARWKHKQTNKQTKTDKLVRFLRLRKASIGVSCIKNRHLMYVTTLGYLQHSNLIKKTVFIA